jgi:hypothetical protein
MSSWATKKFQSPSNGGGVLDGNQKNSITIRHISIVWWWLNVFSHQEREQSYVFGKFHQWFFQKHMTCPFLWQLQGWQSKIFNCRKVNDWNLFPIAICNEGCWSVNKKFHASIAKWLHHINFDNPAWYHWKALDVQGSINTWFHNVYICCAKVSQYFIKKLKIQ